MSQLHSHPSSADDGISVFELADSPDVPAVFSGVLSAYQEQGYESGYRRAVADVLTSMLALTEDYLRQLPDSDATLRRKLHGFEAFVQRHFLAREGAEFVSDGLGI